MLNLDTDLTKIFNYLKDYTKKENPNWHSYNDSGAHVYELDLNNYEIELIVDYTENKCCIGFYDLEYYKNLGSFEIDLNNDHPELLDLILLLGTPSEEKIKTAMRNISGG